MKFLSDILAKAGLTVDGVVTLNNTATGQTPNANDNSTKLATTAWVRTFVQPYSLPIASDSILGGIKVGSGLAIDPTTGVLTATGGGGSGSLNFRTIQEFTLTSTQDTFTINGGYSVGYIEVLINGVYLSESLYTATDGTTVVLDDAAVSGDIVTVFLYSLYNLGESAYARNVDTLTATAGQTSFTTSYIPGQIDVYYNGSKLTAAEYTATTGASIVLGQAAVSGDIIEVVTYLAGAGLNSNRTLTINGTTYDLTANRTWTLTTANISEGTNLYYTDTRVGSYLTTNLYATQSYVSTQINNLINGAPGLLDTLDELAAALGDDANFASTITTSIGTKVPQARTITINGTSYDLSADRSWSIAAGVTSFNTRTGDITPASGDYTTAQVTESSNLYYTNTRARLAISLTTTGTSGAASYDNTTGVLNIPQYQGGVTSFNTRTGAITLSSSDVTTALTYTPVTNARTISINGTSYDLSADRSWTIAPDVSVRNTYAFTATANQTTFTVTGGYSVGLVDVFINGVKLAAADFTATNGTTVVLGTGTSVGNIVEIVKYVSAFTTAQEALNGTGLVRMSGTTVTYDNATYATQSYVTTAVANLVNSAPSTLDTLNELATALGNDANFATTITTSIGTKLALAGGTLTGGLNGTTALFTGNLRTDTGLGLKYGSFVSTSGYLNLFSAIVGSAMTLNLKDGTGGYEVALNFTVSANRSYTFPSANGTIALTTDIPTNNNVLTNGAGYITSSALSSYLPLAGGTLTGALSGTSATFSSSVTSNYTYNGGGIGMLHLTSNGTEGGSITLEKTSGTAQKYKVGNSGTSFFIYNETAGNQPFTLLNNGSTGIGYDSPVYQLQVLNTIGLRANSQNIQAIKGTGWGYSPTTYKVVMLGDTANNVTVSIGYDPSGNANSAFSGTGNEVLFRNGVSFATPTAANTAFHLNTLVLKDGSVGIGTGSPIGPLDIASPAVGSAIAATTSQQAYNFSRLRIKHYSDSNLGLSIGYAGANWTYMQACYNEGSTAPLLLNPFGGDVRIGTGGLKFSNGSSTLNYYQEGSWTPQLYAGASAFTMGGINDGRYVRVGNQVTISGHLQWSSGSGSGMVRIAGLPFTCTGVRSAGSMGAVSYGISFNSGYNHWVLVIDPGTDYIYIIQGDSSGGGYSHTPPVGSSGVIYGFSITYHTL